MSSIVGVVETDKNLSTMSRCVHAAGMTVDLNKDGPFTIFAPSEMAFGKLPLNAMTSLLKPENKDLITELVSLHITEGKTEFKDLTDGMQLKTLNGKILEVKVTDNGVTINGSTIQGKDHQATNGVVHSLDKVISLD
jgi:uncharacterized surface protein with fasciclin (FAS1) repeats